MKKYAFFLDIDGTILYYDEKIKNEIIPKRVIESIKNARNEGHFVYINTGRAPSYFDQKIWDLPVDGFLCGCGAYAIDANRTVLFQAAYPNEALLRWTKKLSNPEDPGLIVEGVNKIFRLRETYWKPREGWILSDDPKDLEEYLKHDSVVKMNLCQDIDTAILPDLQKDFDVIHHPAEHYTECCIPGCSKSEGMKRILALHGMDLSQCVAMGDSENDLDMICTAGIGVAMGQAYEEVRNAADFVTDSVWDAGAATAIDRIITGDRYG